MSTPYLQVSTTTSTREEAERIAAALVEGRLAACVQILGPATSVYRWQDKVERSEEWLCLVKTTADMFGKVEETIRLHHSYECPEIVAVAIVEGSPEYLAWVEAATRQGNEGG